MASAPTSCLTGSVDRIAFAASRHIVVPMVTAWPR